MSFKLPEPGEKGFYECIVAIFLAILPEPGDKYYTDYVDAWITIQLMSREEMENPPIQKRYDEWFQQLSDYTDNEVKRVESGIRQINCTCKSKGDQHAKDCRSHPHRMVILADSKILQTTKCDEFAVESLFLRPTSFYWELLEIILADVVADIEKEDETEAEKHQVLEVPPLAGVDPMETAPIEKKEGSGEDPA